MKANLLNINTNGNKKLVNNSDTRFFIWNIPAIITCPYATERCKKSCYAIKPERIYPSAKSSRYANLNDSMSPDFASRMIETIEYHMNRPSIKGKNIIFRIHESGDFYNVTYLKAWVEIAKRFPMITFMAYTKSVKFVSIVDSIPDNMVIRYSVWDDTKPEEVELASKLGLPIYTAVEKNFDFVGNNYSKCDCSDCANCGKCWDKSNKAIACVIH